MRLVAGRSTLNNLLFGARHGWCGAVRLTLGLRHTSGGGDGREHRQRRSGGEQDREFRWISPGCRDGQYDGHAGGTHRVGAPTRAEVRVTMASDVIVFARAFNTAPDVMPGSNRMATCADLVSSPSLRMIACARQNSITTYKVDFLTGYVCSVLPDRLISSFPFSPASVNKPSNSSWQPSPLPPRRDGRRLHDRYFKDIFRLDESFQKRKTFAAEIHSP